MAAPHASFYVGRRSAARAEALSRYLAEGRRRANNPSCVFARLPGGLRGEPAPHPLELSARRGAARLAPFRWRGRSALLAR